MNWDPQVELTRQEQKIVARLKRTGRFFAFLREVRHELFDQAFQLELSGAGYKTARGERPIPPALLAMVTLLQAYEGASDAEAVQLAEMDMRWQLVLGTLGQEAAPFGQGSLVRFRERMLAHELDRKLVDRTVELAKQTQGFGWQMLRAALDSSPLLGAGKVEDTWNLIGRAMRQLVDLVSGVLQVPVEEVIRGAQLTVLGGASLKSHLDLDWDDPQERQRGLQRLVDEAEALQRWVQSQAGDAVSKPPLEQALNDLEKVVAQDTEPDPQGPGPSRRLVQGTARDRMPSLGDRDMRHGRKSKAKPFTGYKRHIAKLKGLGLIAGAVVLPANHAEHDAAKPLLEDVKRHGQLQELAIDRGYLGTPLISELLDCGVEVTCKPWPLRNRGLFTKEQFAIDLVAATVTCPANRVATFSGPSHSARFGEVCASCDLKPQCTTSERGRSIHVHPQESLLIELRHRRHTKEGRAALRERVTVEHSLARVSALQGGRARYTGTRKNTLDLRRTVAVANLMRLQQMRDAA